MTRRYRVTVLTSSTLGVGMRTYDPTVLTSLTLCRMLTGGSFDGPRGGPLLFFVGRDAFGKGVAVDAENCRSFRQVLSMLCQRLLNIELFKFGECFIQKYLAFQHLLNQV